MADYKNQHFVPRAHFRPFSVGGDGLAINLYLSRRDRAVMSAPVKGQCARDYLYGQDGRLEKLLGKLEGRYAELVRKLADEKYDLDDTDRWLLRYFILLQSYRTAEQIEHALVQMTAMESFFRQAEEAHGNEWIKEAPTRGSAMTQLMLAFNDQMQGGMLDDLKVAILRNRTDHDFITSDDPAVTTNRWLLQRKQIKTFGSNAAGLLLFLPLGPRTLALLYDPAVYSLSASRPGLVDVVRETDVLAFNEHQYMRAVSSIYVNDQHDLERIACEFKAAAPYRPELWDRFTVAKRDGDSATHTRYSVGEPEEIAKEDAILFHLAREWPQPPRWPAMIRYREGAHGFTKGRLIVRRARMNETDLVDDIYYRRTA